MVRKKQRLKIIREISDYTKVIERNQVSKDNLSNAYFNRGQAKFSLNNYSGAIADQTKAVEMNPKYSNAYYFRGLIKGMVKDDDGSCSDLRTASRLGFQVEKKFVEMICKHMNKAF